MPAPESYLSDFSSFTGRVEAKSLNKVQSTRETWIDKGYEHFAQFGPEGMSINQISKELGASRASFYHYFGDIDLFIDELLNVHWQYCREFERKAAVNCQKLIPDLYVALAEYPIPLQFNIQLFRHRHIPKYNLLFVKSFESSARAFALDLFASHFLLKNDTDEIYALWLSLAESWYSRLNPDDISLETLVQHGENILKSLEALIESPLYANIKSK